MSKAGKIILIISSIIVGIFSIIVALIIGGYLLIVALWHGLFNFMLPNEIATYNSPDGEYSLVFEQMGAPRWPFGPTDVRLTLKKHDGKIIERVSTQVFNDGVNASEYNIASISWNDDAVIIVLRASEMEDKEVSIAYNLELNTFQFVKQIKAAASITEAAVLFCDLIGRRLLEGGIPARGINL